MIEEDFCVPVPESYRGGFNFAPGQWIATIHHGGAAMRKWGFIPPRVKHSPSASLIINARSETVFEKVTFKDAIRTSRCLVPSQAFYEWRTKNGRKQPFCIRVEGDYQPRIDAMCTTTMAGIHSAWHDPATGETLDTVAILTCEANTLVARIHNRMPVILSKQRWADWLDPARTEPDDLMEFMVPYTDRPMRAWPVSNRIGDVRNNDATLMRREDSPQQAGLPFI